VQKGREYGWILKTGPETKTLSPVCRWIRQVPDGAMKWDADTLMENRKAIM
jgi:hypothetical protein